MNEEERDDLLIRLDERTRNTWHSVEKLETHQATQNGFIMEAIHRSRTNRDWIKIIAWTGGTVFTLSLSTLLTKLAGIW